MAGGCVFAGPGRLRLPDEPSAPGVIPHDEDGGGVPLVLLLEELADVSEVEVGEGEVVEVGAVGVGEGVCVSIVDGVGVGDGQVEEDEVGGGVGEEPVGGGEEVSVVLEVELGVAGDVDGGANPLSEEGTREGKESGGGLEEQARERLVVVDAAEGGDVPGPEALIEDGGEDAAIGVVPSGDGGGVAVVEGVLKDGVTGLEGLPGLRGGLGGGLEEVEPAAVQGGADVDGGLAGKERREDDFGELSGWLNVGEDGGLGGELVEGGELEAGEAVAVDLLVGELVEEDPDDARPGG